MTDRVLNVLAGKLGIDGPGSSVIRKAEELRRLVSLKTNVCAGLAHLNETCIAVVCLDLAARSLGSPFDAVSGVRLSCVTKPNYTRALHTVERLVGLTGDATPEEVAVRAGAPDLAPLANRILETYKSTTGDKSDDCSHPMYTCAAIKAAAKLTRTAVNREVLTSSCRVKAVQLERLTGRMFNAYSAANPSTTGTPRGGRKRRGGLPTAVDGCHPVKASLGDIEKKRDDGLGTVGRRDDDSDDDGVSKVETIEDWKKRILGC